jgi:predicted ArsR family transcriptional regulator
MVESWPVRGDYRGAARRPAAPAEAKALAHPLRVRILYLCRDAARTNKELADALGRDPGTVLHHVRVLCAEDFLRAEPARTGRRGAREQPYRATGKSWILDFTPGQPPGELPAIVEATVEELQETGRDDVLEAARVGLRLSAERAEALRARLAGLARELGDLPDDPDGEPLALFIVLHRRR